MQCNTEHTVQQLQPDNLVEPDSLIYHLEHFLYIKFLVLVRIKIM